MSITETNSEKFVFYGSFQIDQFNYQIFQLAAQCTRWLEEDSRYDCEASV